MAVEQFASAGYAADLDENRPDSEVECDF